MSVRIGRGIAVSGGLLLLMACGSGSDSTALPVPTGPNVLLVIIDDLRPDVVGAYGGLARTPNLDRFAARGMIFERAYCQQAVCRPSRVSFLTGLRPESTGVSDLQTFFRDVLPDVTTLPQLFSQQGYRTSGIGKIFHNDGIDPDPESWSEPLFPDLGSSWVLPENRALEQRGPIFGRLALGPPFERSDSNAEDHPDGRIAAEAEAALARFAKGNRPFFLAVGFIKPHLPFSAPSEYWDLYDPDALGPFEPASPPTTAPEYALLNSPELRSYHGMPGSELPNPWESHVPINEPQVRNLRHGYFASVSFVDEQVGRVLRRLQDLQLDDDTIVVILSDHGFKLGEHDSWTKHSNFEIDVRSLLMIRAPEQRDSEQTGPLVGSVSDEEPWRPGASTRALVELVDVFPTLCELGGLPLPKGLEGTSLVPLLESPLARWKSGVFSEFPRHDRMGRSIRTEDYRLTEWQHTTNAKRPAGLELYDHRLDDLESINVADWPEYTSIVKDLRQRLRAGWRAARPMGSNDSDSE